MTKGFNKAIARVSDWGVEGPRFEGLTDRWPEVGTLLYTFPEPQWKGFSEVDFEMLFVAFNLERQHAKIIERLLKEKQND